MIEVQRFQRFTKLVRNPDGTFKPVADDDPRASDAQYYLDHPLVLIDGKTPTPPGSYTSVDGILAFALRDPMAFNALLNEGMIHRIDPSPPRTPHD